MCRQERVRFAVVMSAWGDLWGVFAYVNTHEIVLGLAGVAYGLTCGTVMATWRQREYRASTVVGGEPASDDERAAAWLALQSAQLPADPRQREATVSMALSQRDRVSPRLLAVLAGLVIALGVSLPLVSGAWTWWLVGLLLAPAAVVVVLRVRVRRQAQVLLSALPLETGSVSSG